MASESVQGTEPTSDFPREMSTRPSKPRVRTNFIANAAFFARDCDDSGEASLDDNNAQDVLCVEATVEDAGIRHDEPQLPASSPRPLTSQPSVPSTQAPSAGLFANNAGLLPPNVDIQSFISTYNALGLALGLQAQNTPNEQNSVDSMSVQSDLTEGDALDNFISDGSLSTGDDSSANFEDSVNADLFNELLDYFAKEDKCSENISDALARAVNFRAKVPKEKRDKLVKTYSRPANCPSFKTPRVHKIVWKNMTQSGHDTDVVLQLCQTTSCSVAFPLLRLMDSLNAAKMANRPVFGEEVKQCLTLATDAFKLLQFLFSDLSTKRRQLIRDQLNPDFKDLCSDDTPVTDDLFGDDLHQRIKDISTTQQISKKLGRSHVRPTNPQQNRSGGAQRPPFRHNYQRPRPAPYHKDQYQRRQQQFHHERPQQPQQQRTTPRRPAPFLGGKNKPGKPGKTA